MNYSKIYDELILRAKNRKLEGYGEKHHILPRSMGGSDDESNLALLTGREHFIAHKLLLKIHPDSKSMKAALGMMSITRKHQKFKIKSKDYEYGKILLSESKKGVKRHESVRLAISKKTKGVKKSEITKVKMRKPKSKEHILNISKSKRGALNPMYGTISPTRDVPHSDEMKKIISEKTKESTEYPPCPHCGKKTNKGNALRWHYDKCKFKV